MRRTFASVAALVLLGAVATAGAATNTYKGQITDDARAMVQMKVEVRGGQRIVTEFTLKQFPLECDGGTAGRLDLARLEGRGRVSRKGRFALAASNDDQQLRIEGMLRGGEAHGRVKYSGLTEFSDETLDCRTNGLRWTASR